MIARLRGRIAEKRTDLLVVDVHGVGYEVRIPFSTYYELGGEGSDVSLHIYTHVKEDVLSLYGFLTPQEKRLFVLLLQVSGIGPKLAVTILSGLPVEQLAEAVQSGDLVRLNAIPGVGRKTAERLVLELRGKMAQLVAPGAASEAGGAGGLQRDLSSALVNLGYARLVAEKAVGEVVRNTTGQPFEVLLREALKKISG